MTQGRRASMPKGRLTAMRVVLAAEDRRTLEAWQRAQTMPMGQARRGRAILLVAAGTSISEAGRMVGIGRRYIYKWVRRFQACGVAGLSDKPRRGRRAHSDV